MIDTKTKSLGLEDSDIETFFYFSDDDPLTTSSDVIILF
jgi:hypothetical protein